MLQAAAPNPLAAYAPYQSALSPSLPSNEACGRALGSLRLCETRSNGYPPAGCHKPRIRSSWVERIARRRERVERVHIVRLKDRTPTSIGIVKFRSRART